MMCEVRGREFFFVQGVSFGVSGVVWIAVVVFWSSSRVVFGLAVQFLGVGLVIRVLF